LCVVVSERIAGMATQCSHIEAEANGFPSDSDGLTPTAVRELLAQQSILLRLTVHELRRPLGVVGGYLSMIRDGTFGSPFEPIQASNAMLAMAGSVQEMAALIDGLAAVARHEDQADARRRQPCQLSQVVAAAAAAVELEAQARRVRVEQRGTEAEADADPDHLRVAMVNLLGNAIQHSPAGSTVSVAILTGENAVTIAVADSGPGIAPGDVEHVFDPWYRGQSGSEGLGLGLWIVRQIVEWSGGRITVTSAAGGGATFSVVLPSRNGTGRPA
jgi:signal transduction histidine kinase